MASEDTSRIDLQVQQEGLAGASRSLGLNPALLIARARGLDRPAAPVRRPPRHKDSAPRSDPKSEAQLVAPLAPDPPSGNARGRRARTERLIKDDSGTLTAKGFAENILKVGEGTPYRALCRRAASVAFAAAGVDPVWRALIIDNLHHLPALVENARDLSRRVAGEIIDLLCEAGPEERESVEGVITALVGKGFFPPNFVRPAFATKARESEIWYATKRAAQVTNPAYAAWEKSLIKLSDDPRQMKLI